jgi:hypothetical protein
MTCEAVSAGLCELGRAISDVAFRKALGLAANEHRYRLEVERLHAHQQPIPLVEVALTPDLHESCLVIDTLASPMPGSKKTDRNNNITATFEEKPANGPSAINASI